MRQYLLKLFRAVSKVCGQDIKKFINGLKIAFRNQLDVISNLTQKTADFGVNFLTQHQYKSILVFDYSKSVANALKQMSKVMGNNF